MTTIRDYLDTSILLPRPDPVAIQEMLDEAVRRGIKLTIVTLTGGPLAGKTSGLEQIAIALNLRNVHLFTVEEAATIIRNAGFKVEEGVITSHDSQREMVRLIEGRFLQTLSMAIESGKKNIVIVRDRCSIDCAAYMRKFDEFVALINGFGMNMSNLKVSHATIFLDSLGVSHPELYKKLCGNNKARHENAKQAAQANQRLLNVYERAGIKVVRIGNNYTDGVVGKSRAVVNVILSLLDEQPVQSQSALLVQSSAKVLAKQLGFSPDRVARVQQFFDGEWRYREVSGPDNSTDYTITRKFKVVGDATVRHTEIHTITSREYFIALEAAERTGTKIVNKTRYFGFVGKGSKRRLVVIDEFEQRLISSKRNVCRVEMDNPKGVSIPSAIRKLKYADVTGKPSYSNQSIAAGTCPREWPKAA